MRTPPGLRLLLVSAILAGTCGPALAAGNRCNFQARGLAMAFGELVPSSNATVVVPVVAATLNADKAGDCAPGQRMVISGDGGRYFNGSRRMRSASGDFIPYSLSLPTAAVSGPGNGQYQTFTFNGVLTGSAYADASAGQYTDTVIISVTP